MFPAFIITHHDQQIYIAVHTSLPTSMAAKKDNLFQTKLFCNQLRHGLDNGFVDRGFNGIHNDHKVRKGGFVSINSITGTLIIPGDLLPEHEIYLVCCKIGHFGRQRRKAVRHK